MTKEVTFEDKSNCYVNGLMLFVRNSKKEVRGIQIATGDFNYQNSSCIRLWAIWFIDPDSSLTLGQLVFIIEMIVLLSRLVSYALPAESSLTSTVGVPPFRADCSAQMI